MRKGLKQKMLSFLMLFAVGVVFTVVGFYKGGETILLTIGITYMIFSAINAFRYYRIYSNEERRKRYEIMQSEERVAFLCDKARSLTFVIMICVMFLAGLALILTEKDTIGFAFFSLGAFQSFVYIVCYKYLSNKY